MLNDYQLRSFDKQIDNKLKEIKNKKTIVYTNGGEDYLGEYPGKGLDYWKTTGYIKDFKYMYKGYRYFDGKKDIVIVYTNKEWDKKEIARRKDNGFLGIKKYLCYIG